METVLITGGTGLIGTALSELLTSKGYKVIILTRSPKPAKENISYAQWDVEKSFIDKEAIAAADHIIHLAGANVGEKRWTDKRKAEIVNSRVQSAKLVVKALNEIDNKVQTVVSASGIGWYGSDSKGSNHSFVETDPSATGFLGETCKLWEESIQPVISIKNDNSEHHQPVTATGIRLVIFRTGLVFSNKGGAFPEFEKPLKAGIAGILGTGNQVISWIHIDDICRLYFAAIENKNLSGVYNAVAPANITNKELTIKLAKARRKPFIPVHIPRFILKIMLGEMSIEILKSTRADSSKIRNTGFNFLYPTFDAALNELV